MQRIMTPREIAAIRKEYALDRLHEKDLDPSPIAQFNKWWHEANRAAIEEVNAMTLSTTGPDDMADARIVLLKAFDERGFVFFTNYNSDKSQQLLANPKCCLLFFWKELERQVRINGIAEKTSVAESIAYFDSRPEGSKVGAWASPQSMVVAGTNWLKETFMYYSERFQHGHIPRPPHWGGYRVKPVRFEFWQGRPNRMHDRMRYGLDEKEGWKIERLAP